MTPGRAGCGLAGFSPVRRRQDVEGGGESLSPSGPGHVRTFAWAAPGGAVRPGHAADTPLARGGVRPLLRASPGLCPGGPGVPASRPARSPLPGP